MIKVSVIIPVYNMEKYIKQCLDSVIYQTLKDIEIICVNDGSTDHSETILSQYQLTEPRLQIINQENAGLSAARNTGIGKAQGKYLLFLDSDDWLLTDALEELYNIAEENDLDNIYFNAESFYDSDELRKRHSGYTNYYKRNQEYNNIYKGREYYRLCMINHDFRPSACLQMPRKDVLNKYNIRFYDGILHEDNLFTIQAMLVEERVMFVNRNFYQRRVRENSIVTKKKNAKNAIGYFVCMREILTYTDNLDIEEEVWLQLEKFLDSLKESAISFILGTERHQIEQEISGYPQLLQREFMVLVFSEVNNRIKYRNKVAELERVKINAAENFNSIYNSASYRIGRIITYIPRKINARGIVWLIQNRGIRYFLYRLKYKISIRRRIILWKGKRKFRYPFISIIMPVYNAEKTIETTLNSLIGQTMKNIEIICVNDGSTDSSIDILIKYSERDKRISVFSQENQGAAIARNYGLEHAKGKYLLFLDADDTFESTLCEKAYFQAEYDHADICLFGADRYNVQTLKREHMGWVLQTNMLPFLKPFPPSAIADHIFQCTTACPWSKLIRKDFILRNHLRYQNLANANDVLFNRLALVLAQKITYVDEALVLYRFNDGENIQSRKHEHPVEFYKAFIELRERLLEMGLYRTYEKSYINMVVNDSVFNYQTTSTDEAKEKIRSSMREGAASFWDLKKYKEDYFYNKHSYKCYWDIAEY